MSAFIPESDSEDELPPGWEERATLNGEVYYANHQVKTTQWTHPRTGRKKTLSGALPFGWERKILEDGKVLFVNHESKKTTYTDPRLAFAVEQTRKEDTFRQRFDASTTALQILHGSDLSEKIAIVTGANSGIGFEIARSIAFHGCTTIFACRTLRKAEEAIARVQKERKQARCFPGQLDLGSLRSVKAFADHVLDQFPRLDALFLNAGVFGLDFTTTPEDGCETTFQVNFLSHFYLAHLLKLRMSKTSLKPKIIVLSSESHRFSNLSEDSLSPATVCQQSKASFTSMDAYNNSKLLLLMFSLEASDRWSPLGIRCVAVHPGCLVSSNLSRHYWFYRLLFGFVRPFSKSLQQAASSAVFSAFAPEMVESSGIYINNCFPCEPSELALSVRARKECWEIAKTLLMQKLVTIDEESAIHLEEN